MKRNASILVGLLWCVAILSIVVVSILRSATLDLRIVKNYGDRMQAHYLAVAGIEKAKALLFLEARQRREQDINHTGEYYDNAEEFEEIELGRGYFSVIHNNNNTQKIVYGVRDEESRLNVNTADAEALQEIDGITSAIAASIIDYRDGDNEVTQGGAEVNDYAGLEPPYVPNNAPLRTDQELLMVYGVSIEDFVGEDANINGFLDPEENDGEDSFPPDNQNGRLDAGWSGLITTHSGISDVDAKGEARINIQQASESELSQIEGISEELATAIVQYRGENEFQSIADLLDVRRMEQRNQGGGNPQPQNNPTFPGGGFPPGFTGQIPQNIQLRGGGGNGGGANAGGQGGNGGGNLQPTGPTLISEGLLMQIADKVTVREGGTHDGAININTAPLEVLLCIPGIDEQVADGIIRYRDSSGYFPNIAYLLEVREVDRNVFEQIAPRVSVRSEIFRILSEGVIPSTGARERIQVIVQIGSSTVTTLAYREHVP